MSNYKYCIVPMCKNTSITTPDKIFISVPKNRVIREKWCLAMKRCSKKNPRLSTKTVCFVCEDHFELENDMENYIRYRLQGTKIILKPGVVPHIFECQKDPDFEMGTASTDENTKNFDYESSIYNVIIEKMKEYPSIYNLQHPDYKSLIKRGKMWEKVADELGMTVFNLKNKWNNIKHSYCKYLRDVAYCSGYVREWVWASRMEFFRPYLPGANVFKDTNPSTSVDSFETEESVEANAFSDLDGTDSEVTEHQTIDRKTKKSKRENTMADDNTYVAKKQKNDTQFKQDCMENYAQSMVRVEYATENNLEDYQTMSTRDTVCNDSCYGQSQSTLSEMDSVDLLFLGYAKLLKTFSPRSQAVTKLELAKIFTELELEQAE